jgi:hypothetical protein
LVGQQLLGERTLELWHAAAREQGGVALDARHQALLRRHREHLRRVDAEGRGDRVDLAGRSRLDARFVAQAVPQPVDLVEHDHAPALALAAGLHVVAPHREVALGDAGVGGEDEQHRVGVGQHRQGELGLGADGIEARRVEHHQALLEQRVRELDHGMAPARDLDRPRRRGGCRGRPAASIAEAERLGFGDLTSSVSPTWASALQALGRAVSRGRSRSILRVALELADRRWSRAAADRQQAHLGLSPPSHCSSVGHMVVRPALEGRMRSPWSAKKIALMSSDLPRENSATKATMSLSSRRRSSRYCRRRSAWASPTSLRASHARRRATASLAWPRQRL